MSLKNRTPLTPEKLSNERKNGKHRRAERRDNAVTSIVICMMVLFAVIAALVTVYFSYLYTASFGNPDIISPENKRHLEVIFSHAVAVVGGYVAHLAHKNISE